jgi:hypothetical protein
VKRLLGHSIYALWVLVLSWSSGCAAPNVSSTAPTYEVRYSARLQPAQGSAVVSILVRQPASILRSADFAFDAERVQLIEADGVTQIVDQRLRWRPPVKGGELTLQVQIDHQRDTESYDARITESWALLRADDLFPSARTVTTAGAQSRAWLRIDAPDGWSVVTPYGDGAGEWLSVSNPRRRFDRPTGWLAAGDLGVRRDDIASTRVVVAAPRGQQMRRNDILALLRWTLPEIVAVFGPLPSPLTIVGAGDPMWRGGLSALTSLYVHSSRPLISENGTSTLLHEVMHIAIDRRGDDWLVEGLSEYYALEALFRSGSISPKRYFSAQQQLQKWAQQASILPRENSSGAQTALAVTLLIELNTLLQRGSGRKHNLDDVVRQLDGTELSLATLMQAARQVTDQPLLELEGRIEALVK